MKHKFLIFLFVLNEVSGLAVAATKNDPRAFGQTLIGGIGMLVGMLILWMFVRVGMFKGLKFRHYVFLLACVLAAGAAGYLLARA